MHQSFHYYYWSAVFDSSRILYSIRYQPTNKSNGNIAVLLYHVFIIIIIIIVVVVIPMNYIFRLNQFRPLKIMVGWPIRVARLADRR